MASGSSDGRGVTRRCAGARRGALAGSSLLPACDGGAPRCGAPPDGGAGGPLAAFDHLVVVMMENRSFDHLLGALRSDGGYPSASLVDGLRGGESNPDPDGNAVPSQLRGDLTVADAPHDWDSARVQLDGGRCDGFVRAFAGPDQRDAMAFYDRAALPITYALADHYTVCDRWFSSVLGPTWPNRYYLHAATSFGHKSNLPILDPAGPPTVWERLASACRSFENYAAGSTSWYAGAFVGRAFSGDDPLQPTHLDKFFADAAAGTLPDYALIDPDFHVSDDHPPVSLALGQGFLATIVKALQAGPRWSRTLLVILYDEHGGFFDHVAPPTTVDPTPGFEQLGFRVPALVVGPMVRAGFVDSTPREHVSIAATLAARFGIASLGPRMDAARDLASCIDPARAPAPPPPLPKVALSRRAVAARLARPSSQPELDRMLREGRIAPRHVDRRGAAERCAAWLRVALELEAIALCD
jgi:phospholipase C